MNDEPKLGIFSFFAGCGLLDLGFEREGFTTRFVNEYHAPFLQGYQHARMKLGIEPPAMGYSGDSIVDLDPADIAAKVAQARAGGDIVGFTGGPPCPDFSVAGKNRGQEGENGKLSRDYIDLIISAQPDFFVFENVKGLWRTKKHRAFYDTLKADLEAAGYILHDRLINSLEFGAPQDRQRIILIGFHSGSFRKADLHWQRLVYPDKTAFAFPWPDTDPFVAKKDRPAPAGIPIELTVEHWFRKNDVRNHPNAQHFFTPRAGLKRFLTVEEGDVSKKCYKRPHRWRYSPTAAYGNNEVHSHPYEARRISVAEALATQSAPKEFELPHTMTLSAMFKTVGNGVPVLAAQGIAATVRHYIANNLINKDPADTTGHYFEAAE